MKENINRFQYGRGRTTKIWGVKFLSERSKRSGGSEESSRISYCSVKKFPEHNGFLPNTGVGSPLCHPPPTLMEFMSQQANDGVEFNFVFQLIAYNSFIKPFKNCKSRNRNYLNLIG